MWPFAAPYLLPIVPLQSKVGMQILFKSPHIDKFLGTFRWRKSANFLGVTVHKSKIRKFCMVHLQIANPQIS